ncbi:DUF4240 domain-containing protein [Stieleria sp. TO1_6]|uniref:DUF4240 domain-containing protein n=1 Tax=Stieleria tagensis TaxID=2956795 RepID=UPI00209B95E1|nr:DUF4240 domain-containing protein [Stieleria tagensis]MCO8120358.1 DUF4240 domain-containing protein [Stieleria tagensis]
MPNDASKLLPEEHFWTVISCSLDNTQSEGLTADRQIDLLEHELEKLSRDEHTGFLGHFYHWYFTAYRRDLWAVAYTVMGGCSDDCFMEFRMWLVTRGSDVFHAALKNPDSLAPEFDKIPEGDIPLWDYDLTDHFDSRFGDGAHNVAYEQFAFPEEKISDPETQWTGDDEESIRAICPLVFDQYWGNTRF